MNFQEITQFEKKLYSKGIKYVAGIDEVGRGPLAGPFVVSAVILDLEKIFSNDFQEYVNSIVLINNKLSNNPISKGRNREKSKKEIGEETIEINDVQNKDDLKQKVDQYIQIRDSKKLTPRKRNILSDFIINEAISYSIEVFEPGEIDKLGVSKLTQKAFFQSIKNLKIKPQYLLTDMFEVAKITKQHQTNIVNGDDKSISIASASIVAKVFRDEIMIKMHEKYPNYGFDKHKGYGTKMHMEALQKHGICEIHRKSFEPIKSWIKGN
ncbi:ribonuclease HII [Patescibacteria group bacterium]|nr:ribonuclease HII [Patescibacteria group bacterium]